MEGCLPWDSASSRSLLYSVLALLLRLPFYNSSLLFPFTVKPKPQVSCLSSRFVYPLHVLPDRPSRNVKPNVNKVGFLISDSNRAPSPKPTHDCHHQSYSWQNRSHIFDSFSSPIIPHLYSIYACAVWLPPLGDPMNEASALCTTAMAHLQPTVLSSHTRGPLSHHCTCVLLFSTEQPGRSFESKSIMSHYSGKASFHHGSSLQTVQKSKLLALAH